MRTTSRGFHQFWNKGFELSGVVGQHVAAGKLGEDGKLIVSLCGCLAKRSVYFFINLACGIDVWSSRLSNSRHPHPLFQLLGLHDLDLPSLAASEHVQRRP